MTTALRLSPRPFPKNKNLIVGVSGGADSIGLLHLLLDTISNPKTKLLVAHVNYALRGEDSLSDEKWVRRLCRDWDIPIRVFRVRRFVESARKKKRSIQDFAREIRFSFFEQLARKSKAWGVALGHQKEDQAETLLDRLLRGTGSRGLSGLRPVQRIVVQNGKPLNIWRPILAYDKKQITDYLRARDISWREDKTNQGRKYRRNQIRHQLLPFLARWNPKISDILAKVGEITAAEDEFLDQLVGKLEGKIGSRWRKNSYTCDARLFLRMSLALQRRWIRKVSERLSTDARGLAFDRIEDILRLWAGVEKGPRDIGFGLKAGRDGNNSFLSYRNE